ncbi:hypothetical protein A8U91_03426 [Halomonas elongata]|uniref:ABC transporter substrate-binding protein n=1 Tax=Halomonas elongata TaxID=2746 RepID=A0A1B8NWN9_HALEL|nr:hypothetical protein [Halomonas elongata]OBX34373.1 hypothetical protein A8U91_03426 [Halomonas elongata]
MPRRFALALALAGASLATSLAADDTSPLDASWSAIERQARGQTVYWSAWGGDPAINRYIGWVAGRMDERHDLEVVHVKVDDIATTISRIVAEQAAGNDAAGAVDLMWINGENFAAMKERDLLFGPFARRLPNFALTSPDDNPEMLTDFTLPTEGYESPWARRS